MDLIIPGMPENKRVGLYRKYDKACLRQLEELPEVGGLRGRGEGKIPINEMWKDGTRLADYLTFASLMALCDSRKERRGAHADVDRPAQTSETDFITSDSKGTVLKSRPMVTVCTVWTSILFYPVESQKARAKLIPKMS
jgi:hypothetical protein